MKITVMTADEQIISLDVDPHESVTLQDTIFLSYIRACIHEFIYMGVNNLIDTNINSLLLGFLKSGFVSIG
jgi:hypothetical protein